MRTKHLCVLIYIRIKGEVSLSPPRWYFLRGFFFILCLSLLYCLVMVTCWERADFFAPLYVMFSSAYIIFPYGILGQVWYYNINVLQQTACLVVNPNTVGNFAFLFNCTPVGRTSDSMMVPT